MEIDALICTVFNCWATKGNSYLTNIIEEYNNTANDHCVDGDITIWTTRPASPPLHDLSAIKKEYAMWGEASNLSRWDIRIFLDGLVIQILIANIFVAFDCHGN